MIGSTIAVELAAHTEDGAWYCARDKRDNSIPLAGFAFFGAAAIVGGIVGGGVGISFLESISAGSQGRNDRKSGRDNQSSREENSDL